MQSQSQSQSQEQESQSQGQEIKDIQEIQTFHQMKGEGRRVTTLSLAR